MNMLRNAVIAAILSVGASSIGYAQSGYGSTLAGDVAIPLAAFSNSFKTGYGAHVDFYMQNEDYMRVSLLLGYTRWSIDNDKVNQQYASMGGTGTYQLDGGISTFPVLVGLRLLSPAGGFRFYGLVEAGVYLYSGKLNGTKTENGVVTQNIYESMSKSVGGANLGAGLLMLMNKEFSLDICGRYHFVKTNTYYNYDLYGNPTAVSTNRYFSIALGVTWSYPPVEAQ